MKTIITLTTALFLTSFALAETKDELIEKVMMLCNAEHDFMEGTSQVLESLQQELDGEHTDKLINQAREYIRNNSLKPIYAYALDETYTEEELRVLIRYYESIDDEFKPVLRKQAVGFRIAYTLGKAEWTEKLLEELESSLSDSPESRTTADAWNSYTSKEKQIYIRGVMDGSSYTYYNFYYHSKDSVNEATLKPIILNVHSDTAITFGYLELISVMDELYSDIKNQHIAYGEILRTAESKLQGKDISSHLTKLQKQADEKFNKNNPNQRVDPTVKTPVESGSEQGTAGHP